VPDHRAEKARQREKYAPEEGSIRLTRQGTSILGRNHEKKNRQAETSEAQRNQSRFAGAARELSR